MIGFDMEDGRAGGDEIDAFLRRAAAQAKQGEEAADFDTAFSALAGVVAHLARQNDALAELQAKSIKVIAALEKRVAALEERRNVRGPFIRRKE